MKLLAITAALAALSAPAWAVNKCTGPDGKVSFQDAPCAGRGEAIKVWTSQGEAPPKPAPEKLPVVAEPPKPEAPIVQKAPAKSRLEQEADTCLAWYKPKLRDPAGAYYTQPSKEDRVLSMTLHATNGYGGYTTKKASCEIDNGQLDTGWTKIHARRGGWPVE